MILEVRVQPRARRNSVEVVEEQRLRVYVTAAPESEKANEAVIALLAKMLGVARSTIRIVRGHRGRNKQLHIEGITTEEALARLSAP